MVQIEQHVWGMTPEGEAIILYTLRNDSGAEVQLTNWGAAIVSGTQEALAAYDPSEVEFVMYMPEAHLLGAAAAKKAVPASARC